MSYLGYLDDVPVMLPNEGSEFFLTVPGYITQRKYDGTWVVVKYKNDEWSIITRKGKSNLIDNYKNVFLNELEQLTEGRTNFIGVAELVFLKNGTDKDYFLSAASLPETWKENDVTPHLYFHDLIEIDATDFRGISYASRMISLLDLFSKDHKHVHFMPVS